jgi:AraC-like DNA-binding protein
LLHQLIELGDLRFSPFSHLTQKKQSTALLRIHNRTKIARGPDVVLDYCAYFIGLARHKSLSKACGSLPGIGVRRTPHCLDANNAPFSCCTYPSNVVPWVRADLSGAGAMSTAVFHCQYAGQTSGPRYEAWREEFGRKWISADFRPIGSDYIDSEISATQLSNLTLGTMRGTPLHIDRRNDMGRDTSSKFFLVLASGCPMRTSQRGRSIDLAPGEMTLMSGGEPARLTQLTKGVRWSIRIPRRQLTDICKNVEDRITRPIANSELGNLLLHQVETANRFGPRLDATANHRTAQYILDLVALCLGVGGDSAEIARQRGLGAARLQAIKAQILASLGNPELGLAQIAASQRVSTRYVQHLFGLSGESFTGFVLEQRLLSVHRYLRDPKNRSSKVSYIADVAGFSDISYFNRAFRARFGATPTDVRASSEGDVASSLPADAPTAR